PPETKVLYRPPQAEDIEDDEDVCSRCGGVGYFGRTGMIEFIEMTEDMRQVVAGGAAADAIKAQARTEKMQSFQSDGLRLVAEGKTSLEELQRAFRGK
ncbi:MAG: secretion system protein E, partial [Planctomycetota bacterium]